MIITTNSLPTHCEFCGSELVWDSMNLVCSNQNCRNLAEEKIKAFVTNIAPIDGMGWKTFKKLLDETNWKIDTVFDLLAFAKDSKCRFIAVKQGSEKDLFNKTLDKLNQPTTISKFLLALKIPGIGKIGAEAVESYVFAEQLFSDIVYCQKSKDDVAQRQATLNILASLLQDTTAAINLLDFNKFEDYYYAVKMLYNNSEAIKKEIKEEKGKVVITGTLSISRSDFTQLLKENGWTLQNKINKETKYLITNTPDSGTSKNREADKLGITKITESEFVKEIM